MSTQIPMSVEEIDRSARVMAIVPEDRALVRASGARLAIDVLEFEGAKLRTERQAFEWLAHLFGVQSGPLNLNALSDDARALDGRSFFALIEDAHEFLADFIEKRSDFIETFIDISKTWSWGPNPTYAMLFLSVDQEKDWVPSVDAVIRGHF